MSEHHYFTVEPTALTIPERGALAIYCGDAPRKTETGTSRSLRAPLLVMPPELFTDADETMAKVASVLNDNAGKFYPSACVALDEQAAPADDDLRSRVRAALGEVIGGDAYDCIRVWDAWSVGTMGEDDFEPVIDRLDEITDVVLAALPFRKGGAA